MSKALALGSPQKSLPEEEEALKLCLVGAVPATAAGNLSLTWFWVVTEMFCWLFQVLSGWDVGSHWQAT